MNRPRALLLLLGVVAVMLWAAGRWTNIQRWGGDGGADAFTFFRGLGIDGITADALMSQFASLSTNFLIMALAAFVGLLFVGAVRWQRRHTR